MKTNDLNLKSLITVVGLALFSLTTALSQTSYNVSYVDSAKNPLGINTDADATTTGWTAITSSPQSKNVWSDTVSIPFYFEFFGSQVTHIRASQNGLVTFTKNPTKLPFRENTNLPSDSLPDSTIAVFWDEFTTSPPTGSGDNVYVKTFGSAPHRQFYIRWHSFEMGNFSSFNYFAVALEESTNKIYVVDMSYYSANLSTTVGVQLNNSVAVQYGDSTLPFAKSSSSSNSNNSYYEFDPFTLSSNDLSLTAIIDPTDGCNLTSSSGITVSVYNLSINPKSSIPVAYQVNGGTIVRDTVFGTVNSLEDTAFTFSTKADLTAAGGVTIVAWTDFPGDPDNSNDTVSAKFVPFSGTFTIGGSSPDYKTFNDAITALKSNSLCGPVTFKVRSGTYTEQITIPEISGASSTNTVTFTSESGDSTDVILQYGASGSSDNWVVLMDGADWIRFTNMTLKANGSNNYGQVIVMQNGATNNEFRNNQLLGENLSSTSTNVAVVYSNGSLDDKNLFDNNLIDGGSYGFYWYGDGTTSLESGTVISNNQINTYYYGIRLYYQNAPMVRNNHIEPLSPYSTYYGVYAVYADSGFVISGNQIYFATSGYGIYNSSCDATSIDTAMVYNNMISIGTTSTAYGIYNSSSSWINYYHNSVDILSTSTTYRAFYVTGTAASDLRLFNNSFANSGGGYAAYINQTSAISAMDYNNLYTTGTYIGYWGSAVTDLSSWQSTTSVDANSISVDPTYKSTTDLHTKSNDLNNAGTPVGVTIDIDGDIRSSSSPDIGADEFTPPANDLRLLEILAPAAGCGDSNTVVTVVVDNRGTSTQSSIPVVVKISGAINTTLSQTFSKSLANGDIDTFSLSTTINTYSGGNINLTGYTNLSGDQDNSNDTSYLSASLNAIPAPPITTSASRCGSGTLSLGAQSSSGLDLSWYDAKSGGNKVNTGTSLTRIFSSTKTYYVEAADVIPHSISTTFNDNNGCGSGNMFDIEAYNTIIIDSFAGNFSTSSNGNVRVYYKKGSYSGYESDSTVWTFLGSTVVSYNSQGTPTTFDIGKTLTIPAGQTYGIYIMYYARYTNGDNTYSNNDLKITAGAGHCSNFSSGIASRTWNGTIYYRAAGCPSQRVPVTATIRPAPKMVSQVHESPFQGRTGNGTPTSPDTVCVGDTVTYGITPPSGYSNLNLGSAWTITSLVIERSFGIPPVDTATFLPNANANARLQFVPDASEAGYTFKVEATVAIISSGCDTTLTNYVYVAPVPSASFSAADVCDGQAVNFINSSTGQGTMSYLWNLGDNNTSATKNPTHTYADTGTYQITLTVKLSGGCEAIANGSVTVNETPTADFSLSNVCDGETATFTNNSSISSGTLTYGWDFDDGNGSTATSPSHLYGQPGAYDIVLIALSPGCSDTSTKTMNVYPKPVANFSTSSVCNGDSIKVKDMSQSGSGTNANYNYEFEGQSSTIKNPSFYLDSTGLFSVSLKVTNSNGCADSISQQVSIFDQPKANFGFTEVCFGEKVHFSDSSVASGNLKYTWMFGDGNSSSAKSPSYTYSDTGNFEVMLVVSNNDGCADTATAKVRIGTAPSASFTVDDICLGESAMFNNTTTINGNIPVSYNWLFGDGNSDTVVNPVHQYAAAGNYNIVLLAMTNDNCLDSAKMQIAVNDTPTSNFTFSQENGVVDFKAGVTTYPEYKWNFGNGQTSTLAEPTIIFTVDTTYTVTLQVGNTAGCVSSSSQEVDIDLVSGLAETRANSDAIKVFPNPFQNKATIQYSLDRDASVKIEAIDAKGILVAVLIDNKQSKGSHQVTFNPASYHSTSGMYLIRFVVNGKTATKTLIRIE